MSYSAIFATPPDGIVPRKLAWLVLSIAICTILFRVAGDSEVPGAVTFGALVVFLVTYAVARLWLTVDGGRRAVRYSLYLLLGVAIGC